MLTLFIFQVGFGAPQTAYVFYLLKHLFWFQMWVYFCGYGPELEGSGVQIPGIPASWSRLCASPDAIQRLVLWNLLFEDR